MMHGGKVNLQAGIFNFLRSQAAVVLHVVLVNQLRLSFNFFKYLGPGIFFHSRCCSLASTTMIWCIFIF